MGRNVTLPNHKGPNHYQPNIDGRIVIDLYRIHTVLSGGSKGGHGAIDPRPRANRGPKIFGKEGPLYPGEGPFRQRYTF